MPSTIKLHRVLRAPPDRVYRAFTTADAMVKWLPPNGYTAAVHHFDAKVGGTFRMSFTNIANGHSHAFGGTYLELEPGRRIVHTDEFDDPNFPGQMRVEIKLTKVSCGTELSIEQQGVPDVIPAESCYIGWGQSLALLGLLVEAETSE